MLTAEGNALFGLVISLAVALCAMALTSAVGVPIAVRLARPQVWTESRIAALSPDRITSDGTPSFEPLDLGPDLMHWPSESPWQFKGRAELPWPSETWDDPHFGQHKTSSFTGAAADAAFEKQKRQRQQRAADQRAAEQQQRRDRAQRSSPTPETLQDQARHEVEQMRQRMTGSADQLRAKAGASARHAQSVREAAAATSGAVKQHAQRVSLHAEQVETRLPSREQLESLVTDVGLAGTVQEIMKRTGWDFKTAAQYLAKARRGR